ncbi:unnamed protein product, partial [Phaeothamnion confervicola]
MMFGTRECFGYFQCADCGCLQIDSIPQDLHRFYPPDYGSFGRLGRVRPDLLNWLARRAIAGQSPRFLKSWALARPFAGEVAHLAAYGLDLTRAAVLDVGAGAGARVAAFRRLGLVNAEGIDPFVETDILVDNVVLVRKAEIGTVDGRWSAILFHHSLEHLPDQMAALQAARRRLA